MQRLQGHDKLRGRAIRVRDNVFAGVTGRRFRIYFRHDQRYIGIHTEMRRIVYDNAALRRRNRSKFRRYRSARRKECEIHPREIEALKSLHFQVLTAKGHFASNRPLGRERNNFRHRKLSFMQNIQHFAAHIASGTDYRNSVSHDLNLFSFPAPPRRGLNQSRNWQELAVRLIQLTNNGVTHFRGRNLRHTR